MTKEQILQKHFTAEFGHDGHDKFMQYILNAMEEYAQQQVKNLNIPAVSNSLPVDYLQTEMIKAIKELAKESTAPDKVTPDWMENDIKRGMQWMHKRLTGNDC